MLHECCQTATETTFFYENFQMKCSAVFLFPVKNYSCTNEMWIFINSKISHKFWKPFHFITWMRQNEMRQKIDICLSVWHSNNCFIRRNVLYAHIYIKRVFHEFFHKLIYTCQVHRFIEKYSLKISTSLQFHTL